VNTRGSSNGPTDIEYEDAEDDEQRPDSDSCFSGQSNASTFKPTRQLRERQSMASHTSNVQASRQRTGTQVKSETYDSPYQKSYATSSQDRSKKGSGVRLVQICDSDSEKTSISSPSSSEESEVTPGSPTQRSTEGSSRSQDQVFEVEASNPSQHPSVGTSVASSRKRRRSTEVTRPKPSLIVRLKLTREKEMSQSRRVNQPEETADDSPSPEPENLQAMKGIRMDVNVRREVLATPTKVLTMTLEDIMSRGEFFEIVREELLLTDDLDEKDVLVRANVKRVSDPPVAGLRTEFIMTVSTRNYSWENLLEGLQEHYDRTGSFVIMKLEAIVLVKDGPKLVKDVNVPFLAAGV